MKKNRPMLTGILIILPLLFIFFHKVIFLGYSLWPTDYIFSLLPWKSIAPEGYRGPSNHLLFDNVFLFYPWFHLASEFIRKGVILFWNPYISCGWPFFANSTGFFFPLNIVFYFLPLWYAFGVSAFLKLFFAGFFTFLFLRSVSVNVFGSAAGAIAFMFSGFMVTWLGHPHSSIAVCLPLLFLLSGKLVANRSLLNVSLLSLGVCASFLGGHYETTFHVLAATGFYFFFCLFTQYRMERDVKRCFLIFVFFLCSIMIGIAMASIQIIPAWEYISQSSRQVHIGGGGSYLSFKALVQFFISLKALVLYVIPDFYGNPVDMNEWGSAAGISNYIENSGYAGVLPLFLAFFTVIILFKDRLVKFFAGLVLLSLCIVYNFPLIADIVTSLPLFAKLNNNRFVLIYCFAIAVLSGYGVNCFVNELDRNRKKIYLFLIIVFSFSVFFASGLWYLIYQGELSGIVIKNNVQDYISGKISFFLLLSIGGTLLLFIYAQRYINKKVFQIFFVMLIAADLLVFGMRFWPNIEPKQIFPSTPAIEFLKKDKDIFRIYAVGNILSINSGVPFRLYDIRGYDGITLMEYEEFITGKTGDNTFFMNANYNIPIHIDLMNVKYILMRHSLNIQDNAFTLVYRGEVDIYRNNNYLPRAFIANKATVVKDKQETLKLLYSRTFDPSREVVIDADLPSGFKSLAEAASEKNISAARVIKYEHDAVTLDVETQGQGILVLSDTFYPGWKAFVDGVESPIYRADYIFRAVLLEKGKHRVEFFYRPESFKIGAIISLLAVLFVLAMCIFEIIKIRNKKA